MKLGIILETAEPEKAWNGCRFALTALKNGHAVKLFLMGEAVTCEGIAHPNYPAGDQLRLFAAAGGEILACGTCIRSRGLEETLEVCPISTMVDCVEMVAWADKTVTF
ncbi:MAG: DsrE family protein [Marinilabiliales bacterium]|nr:DsrE family protein [Marinilabiliales bacterium]